MYYKDAALSMIKCADAPLENIKMVVYLVGGLPFLPGARGCHQKFIPDAQLEFAPDMKNPGNNEFEAH